MFVSHLRDVRESFKRCSWVTGEMFSSHSRDFLEFLRFFFELLERCSRVTWDQLLIELIESLARSEAVLESLEIHIYSCIWMSHVTPDTNILMYMDISSHSRTASDRADFLQSLARSEAVLKWLKIHIYLCIWISQVTPDQLLIELISHNREQNFENLENFENFRQGQSKLKRASFVQHSDKSDL